MRILLKPDWPAPPIVSALTTTREEGISGFPYHYNNLALHVGDENQRVLANRQRLRQTLQLPGEPVWLEQTHSNVCVIVEDDTNRIADAAVTRSRNFPLVIMTADCLPVLLCDRNGQEIAAIHAGWRGMVNGIIESTLVKMKTNPDNIIAWVGPAICSSCFEVGEDVLKTYQLNYPFAEGYFCKKKQKNLGAGEPIRYLANLPQLAEKILQNKGVSAVYQSGKCTFEDKNQFYSYRRDAQTGRMATLIWFNQD